MTNVPPPPESTQPSVRSLADLDLCDRLAAGIAEGICTREVVLHMTRDELATWLDSAAAGARDYDDGRPNPLGSITANDRTYSLGWLGSPKERFAGHYLPPRHERYPLYTVVTRPKPPVPSPPEPRPYPGIVHRITPKAFAQHYYERTGEVLSLAPPDAEWIPSGFHRERALVALFTLRPVTTRKQVTTITYLSVIEPWIKALRDEAGAQWEERSSADGETAQGSRINPRAKKNPARDQQIVKLYNDKKTVKEIQLHLAKVDPEKRPPGMSRIYQILREHGITSV